MADVNMDQIIESLSSLTVMQIADLTKKLEDKWGVKAAPVAVAGVEAVADRICELLGEVAPGPHQLVLRTGPAASIAQLAGVRAPLRCPVQFLL